MFETLEAGIASLQQKGLSINPGGLEFSIQGHLVNPGSDPNFLQEQLKEWLSGHPPKPLMPLLLVLGEAGSGKTTSLKCLEKELWSAYKPGEAIPLRIEFLQFADSKTLVEDALAKLGFSSEQIKQLKTEHSFTLLLDGYDETYQFKNVYTNFGLPGWNARIIVTARTEPLEWIGDYDKYFVPLQGETRAKHLLSKLSISPLSRSELAFYFTQAKISGLSFDELMDIPGVKALASTPLFFKSLMSAFPRVASVSVTDRKRVCSEVLIDARLEWQKQKLEEGRVLPKGFNFTAKAVEYYQQLAMAMQEKQLQSIVKPPASHLFGSSKKAHQDWLVFFKNDVESQFIRAGLWVRRLGKNSYGFSDKILGDYFATLGGVSQKRFPEASSQPESEAVEGPLTVLPTIARKLYTRQEDMVRNFADRVIESDQYKQKMFKYIDLSKTDERYAIAAANAITGLNRARVSFSGMDFSDVKIADAVLSNGIFDNTNFRKANLERVNFECSWLRKVNLEQAVLKDIVLASPFFLFSDSVSCCCYSSDERYLAVGVSDKIYLYNTLNWEIIFEFHGLGSEIICLKIGTVDEKNKWLIAGDKSGSLLIWEISSKILVEVNQIPLKKSDLSNHALNEKEGTLWGFWSSDDFDSDEEDPMPLITSIDINFDGGVILIGDNTGNIWILDRYKKYLKNRLTVVEAHTKCFGPSIKNGISYMATLGEGTVECNPYYQYIYGTSGVVFGSGPNGFFASSGRDGSIMIWNFKKFISKFKPICITQTDESTCVASSFLDDTELFAFGDASGNITCFGFKEGLVIQENMILKEFSAHPGSSVTCLAFSKNGLLVSGGKDQKVNVWDYKNWRLISTFSEHRNIISTVSCSQKGVIVSGSYDGTLRISDVNKSEILEEYNVHNGEVLSVSVLPEKNFVASGGLDGIIRVWDILSKQLIFAQNLESGPIISIAFYQSKTENLIYIACGLQCGKIYIFDINKNVRICIFNSNHGVKAIQFYKNQVISGHINGDIKLWEIGNEKSVFEFTNKNVVQSISVCTEKNLIAFSSYNGGVSILDIKKTEIFRKFHLENKIIFSTFFKKDGNLLATDLNGFIWDLDLTSQENPKMFAAFEGLKVESYEPNICFLDSRKWLAIGTAGEGGGVIRIWDLHEPICCIQTIQNIPGVINSLSWFENKKNIFLISGDGDKSVRLWKVEQTDLKKVNVYLYWAFQSSRLIVMDVRLAHARDLSERNRILLENTYYKSIRQKNSDLKSNIGLESRKFKKNIYQSAQPLNDQSALFAAKGYQLVNSQPVQSLSRTPTKLTTQIPKGQLFRKNKVTYSTEVEDAGSKFLQLVAYGKQEEAEKMLKKDSSLALYSGRVKDLSGRTFNDITGLQYAVWALDWHMWEMVLQHTPREAAINQSWEGSWTIVHGVDASQKIQNLIDALWDYFYAGGHHAWERKWAEVGKIQREVPIHVINEYCHPTRSFGSDCFGLEKDYKSDVDFEIQLLPRIMHINGILVHEILIIPGLGIVRADLKQAFAGSPFSEKEGEPFGKGRETMRRGIIADRAALIALLETRKQQKEKLLSWALKGKYVENLEHDSIVYDAKNAFSDEYKNESAVIKLLEKFDCKIYEEHTLEGLTIFLYAVINGHTRVMEFLVQKKPEIYKKQTNTGCSAFTIAVLSGKVSSMRLLLAWNPEFKAEEIFNLLETSLFNEGLEDRSSILKFGIKPRFLKWLENAKLAKLFMCGLGVDDEELIELCQALVENKNISEIELSFNIFSDRGAGYLLRLAKTNQNIVHINLNYNNLSDSMFKKIDQQLTENRLLKAASNHFLSIFSSSEQPKYPLVLDNSGNQASLSQEELFLELDESIQKPIDRFYEPPAVGDLKRPLLFSSYDSNLSHDATLRVKNKPYCCVCT